MAYERLNLATGDVFEASHVSHIEDGIVDCEDQCSELKDSLPQFTFQSVTLAGESTRNISFNTVLILFVFRGSTSKLCDVFVCDQWNGVCTVSGDQSGYFSLTCADKVATLTNNSSSNCRWFAIYNT